MLPVSGISGHKAAGRVFLNVMSGFQVDGLHPTVVGQKRPLAQVIDLQ